MLFTFVIFGCARNHDKKLKKLGQTSWGGEGGSGYGMCQILTVLFRHQKEIFGPKFGDNLKFRANFFKSNKIFESEIIGLRAYKSGGRQIGAK